MAATAEAIEAPSAALLDRIELVQHIMARDSPEAAIRAEAPAEVRIPAPVEVAADIGNRLLLLMLH
jgi:hypothetical protein